MVRIAVFGDTHVPSRADTIPEWVREEVSRADHAIHTGDFDSPEAFEAVQDFAEGDLTAVRGNMDPDLGLPDVEVLDIEGTKLVLTHGTGDLASYERRVTDIAREEGGEEATAIAGHTHQATDTTVEGTRLLNPGSATGADPAPTATMFVLAIEDGTIEVSRHEE
ncbi:YfcE family phosphodiesterase [Halobacteriales archaeon QH_8_64_26]|jgi:putative phosphoesterase|nr:MAG: YfcE family phosphodiesterase [Halobacteriales archaeon QH_8_64_26]